MDGMPEQIISVVKDLEELNEDIENAVIVEKIYLS